MDTFKTLQCRLTKICATSGCSALARWEREAVLQGAYYRAAQAMKRVCRVDVHEALQQVLIDTEFIDEDPLAGIVF